MRAVRVKRAWDEDVVLPGELDDPNEENYLRSEAEAKQRELAEVLAWLQQFANDPLIANDQRLLLWVNRVAQGVNAAKLDLGELIGLLG